jgi:hypothetical protein
MINMENNMKFKITKSMKKTILGLISVLIVSCGTMKTVSIINYSTPIDTKQAVEVMGIGQQIPSNYKLLGSIKIGDGGFTTKCSYAEVITDAQIQARAMGGNVLVITKHKEPDAWSSCHRINADVYLKK